jgi:quercetin dioxygenase-like cupin family protein
MLIRYRIDFGCLDWVSPIPGVRHKVFEDGKRRVRLVEYTQGMEPHWCSRGHFGSILEGRFEIEFDDHTEIFETGDGVFIPNGEKHRHRARVLSPVVMVIFVEDK